jgi:carboxymethylenebutenolidase
MDHQVTRGSDQEEAIGAHGGFRIRVLSAWDAASRQFKVSAFVRGSETEEEIGMDTHAARFALIQDAQDHGFTVAMQWIDRQEASPVTTSSITLVADDGFHLAAYVAEPPGQPKGAVVVLQEIFGVNSHIRSVADGYAAAGYVAVAPSTFDRIQPGVELGYAQADMAEAKRLKAAAEALPAPGVLRDVQAAVDHAAKVLGGTGKVGIVGYCWGGLLAWRAAAMARGLSAAVTYYGGGMTMGKEPSRQPAVPVMAHFGDKDAHITVDSVQAFAQMHPEVEVHRYAADHGFNCDQRGAYNASAAATARERSLYHFGRHLIGA